MEKIYFYLKFVGWKVVSIDRLHRFMVFSVACVILSLIMFWGVC